VLWSVDFCHMVRRNFFLVLSNMFDYQAQIMCVITSSLESSLPPSLYTGTHNMIVFVSDILCVSGVLVCRVENTVDFYMPQA
jgi:hypothetical protein